MAIAVDTPRYRQRPDLDESTRDMTVALIRERIARNEYEVDAQAVAAAILERLLAVTSAVADRDARN